jgi:hypothetical protein
MESLLSTDRCDSCNAQGYVQVIKGEQQLVFCGHHYHKNAESLEKAGWEIAVDTRELLTRRAVGVEVS